MAEIAVQHIATITAVIKAAGAFTPPVISSLSVAALGKLMPALLVCDIDQLQVDPLETLRQIRFVLPDCIIVVYTTTMKRAWGRQCHLAGANGVLLQDSSVAQLTGGLISSLQSGCFTDPRFAPA